MSTMNGDKKRKQTSLLSFWGPKKTTKTTGKEGRDSSNARLDRKNIKSTSLTSTTTRREIFQHQQDAQQLQPESKMNLTDSEEVDDHNHSCVATVSSSSAQTNNSNKAASTTTTTTTTTTVTVPLSVSSPSSSTSSLSSSEEKNTNISDSYEVLSKKFTNPIGHDRISVVGGADEDAEKDDSDGASIGANTDDEVDDGGGSGGEESDRHDGDDSQNDDVDNPPLSEYELLRLRNIERNNRRLAELGLLHNFPGTNATGSGSNNYKGRHTSHKKERRKRTTASDTIHIKPTGPVRRSTRLSRGTIHNTDDPSGIPSEHQKEDLHVEDQQEEEEEVQYTISPLLQYDMSSKKDSAIMTEQTSTSDLTEDSTTTNSSQSTLLPSKSAVTTTSAGTNAAMAYSGTRLIPPKGLGAIYSLSFYGDTSWIVGAGKSGMIALWNENDKFKNTRKNYNNKDDHDGDNNECHLDPILSWKAHSGRWIADACFLPTPPTTGRSLGKDDHQRPLSQPPPSRLVTAGNDGSVCLWDLSCVDLSGSPKLLHRSGKEWHASGIFSMDVKTCVSRNGTTSTPSLSSQPSDILIATGSKDKTIIVRSFDESFIGSSSSTPFTTLWRSSFHTAKVGCVQFNPSTGSSLLASASDDGIVAVHDYRSNGSGTSGNVQATIDYYLVHGGRPHSVVWHPKVDHVLATAGLDKAILLWDLRNVSHPLTRLDGHVPISTTRCKKIHRPTIWSSDLDHNKNNNCGNVKHWGNHDDDYWSAFVLTGGEGSGSMSMYEINRSTTARSGGTIVPEEATASLSMTCPGPSPTAGVFSQLLCRGRLPSDCGDAGCIAVRRQSHNHHHYRNNNHHHQDISMAVSVDDGEVLVLTSKLQLP